MPPAFVLVGLFEVWVPRAVVERHVGRGSGAAAIFWRVLLATLQVGPLYAAFPVAVGLWRKGCAPRNVFIYLGAFSATKIPRLTIEVAFLGWRFSLARTLITLPLFLLLAMVMERLRPSAHEPPAIGVDRGGAADTIASGVGTDQASSMLTLAASEFTRSSPHTEGVSHQTN